MDKSKVVNAFFAVVPPPKQKLELSRGIAAIGNHLADISWVQVDDLHVTLGYIADFELEDLPTFLRCFDFLTDLKPIKCTIASVEFFGSAICLLLEPVGELDSIHQQLIHKLRNFKAAKYRFKLHDKFRPHLTIGRVKRKHPISQHEKDAVIESLSQALIGKVVSLTEKCLMARVETSQPYQRLHQYGDNA